MPQLQSIKTLLNQVRDAQQQTSNQVPGQHPEMVVSTQGPEGEQQYSEVVAQYNPRLKTSVAPQFQQYEDAKYKYLDADISDVDIPDPPKDDSHTTRMELEEIEEVIQEAKLPSKLLRVSNEDPLRLFYSVAKKKGLDPHEAEAKAWADDWTKFSFELKDKYQRRRPWEVKKEHDIDFVHHKLDSTESPSYPSGHAMLAYGVAEFYKKKYPLMEEQWDEIAELISHSRVQMGVHYPSDIKASKQVVAQVSGKIKTGSERLRTTIFGVDPEGKLLHGFGDKGFYKFPGGGVDAGESITDAAKRELLEEAGYRVNSIEELAGLDTADSVGASSAKGHMGHGSSRTKYLLARLGDRDSSLLGSEGDAISGLQTAGIDEVIQGLEGDMLFGSGVAGSNHAALTRLKAILQKTAAPKHLELRRQQRAKYLDPENLKTIEDKVQSASDLPEGANYITLPHGRKAVVRTEGGKSHVATILGPAMRPPGRDVSSMVKEAIGFNKQLFIKEAVVAATRKIVARRMGRYSNYANRSKVPKAPGTPKRKITRQQFNKKSIRPPVKAAPSPTTPTPTTTSPTSGGRMQGIGNFVNQHPGAAIFGGVTAVGGTTLGVNKYQQHQALQQAPAFRKASSYKQANDLSVLNKLGAIDLLTGQMGAGKSTLLDKIRDQYDIVEGTDLGGVVDGKFIEPSAEDKPRLRQEKADRLLAAHNEGKRVLMEGYPPGLFRIPGMVEAADRAVVLQPDTLQRLMQIGNRSKERGTPVEEDIRYAVSPEFLAKENKYLDMLRKAIGTTHTAPTSEDAEAYLLGKQANDLSVLTEVPSQNLDLIMRKGLASQKAISEDPELTEAFLRQRDRKEEDWRKELADALKGFKPDSRLGPSVFFTDHDPDKVSDPRHFINQFDTKQLRVNLSKLLKDIPETRFHGVELEPFNEEAWEADPDNYPTRRHRDLTTDEIAKYIATDPKEMWKHYKDEYQGKLYAGDVPHGMVVTPSGIIPPEYLEQVEKTSEAKTLYHGSPLDLEELIPQQARSSRGSSDEHRQKAVYLAKDPKEALLYALMSRPDGLGNYGVADGTAYYPEGRPLNERGYVYKVDVDDYQEPEDPRAGVAIKEPLIPSSREEVLLKDHLDKLVSLPNHEAYRAKIRDILTKTSEEQPLLRHRSTLLIRDPETGKVLAANNRDDSRFDGISPYFFPGGGLYSDEYSSPRTPTEEEIIEGARREALEELGIGLDNPSVIGSTELLLPEYKEKALAFRGAPYIGKQEHYVLADKGKADSSLYNVEGDAFTKGDYYDPQTLYESLERYGRGDNSHAPLNAGQAKAIKEHLLSKTSEEQPLLRHRSTLLVRDPETNKLLAAKETDPNSKASPYFFPGGGLYEDEYDTPRTPTEEEIIEGARREALEELGIQLDNPRVVGNRGGELEDWWKEKTLKRRGVPYLGGHEHYVLADKGKEDRSLYNIEGDAFEQGDYHDPKEVYKALSRVAKNTENVFAPYNKEQARAIKEHLLSKQVAS